MLAKQLTPILNVSDIQQSFSWFLYKARWSRAQDQADFQLIAPRLDATARAWLVDGLARTEAGHRWIAALSVDLREARLGNREVIAALLDGCLDELADHRDLAAGATDSRSYPYLDAYFSEPGRYPFLIGHNDARIVLPLHGALLCPDFRFLALVEGEVVPHYGFDPARRG